MAADEYLIQSKKVELIKQLEQFKQNYSQFWLRLLAPAEYNHLKLNIEDITDVHLNQSCDLNRTLVDLLLANSHTSQHK